MATPVLVEEFAALIKALKISLNTPIAVAVSGGADSMALTLLASKIFPNLTGLVVNHKLRAESHWESREVQTKLQASGVNCHVIDLMWSQLPDVRKMVVEAREARYKVLLDHCYENNIPYLFVGHHKDDQIETFLYRLGGFSRIDGLAGMKPIGSAPVVHPHSSKVQLVRPFLDIPKSRLLETCRNMNVNWVEDPTNKNPVYLRNHIRTTLEKINDPFLTECIYKTQKNLQHHKQHIEKKVEEVKAAHVEFNRHHRFAIVTASEGKWIHDNWLGSRVLTDVASWVTGQQQIPNIRMLTDILSLLQENGGGVDRGTTFGGCVVKNMSMEKLKVKTRKIVMALQPPNSSDQLDPVIRSGETKIWHNRFAITLNIPNVINPTAAPRYYIRSMEDDDVGKLKQELYTGAVTPQDLQKISSVPSPARFGIPVIASAKRVPLAFPTFGLHLQPKEFNVKCHLL